MIFVSRTIFCFLFVLCMTFYPQTYKQGSWGGGGGRGVSYPFPYQCIIYAALFSL